MTNSIREALESAMEEKEKETNEATSSAAKEEPAKEEPAKQEQETAKQEPAKQEQEQEQETGGSKEDPKESVRATDEEEKKEEKPRVKDIDKPPVTWKAGAKERWAKLDPEVRQEIHRREREISTGLSQAAEKGKFADRFTQTIAPYSAVLAAEGVRDPLVAVQNLFQTVTTLRMGTPYEKAMQIAQVIEAYGVPIKELDEILSGNAKRATSEEARIEQLVNQRLAPIQQRIQQFDAAEGASQQKIQEEARNAVTSFADEAEFFDEVRQDMADILDLATRRGRQMTLQDAYNKACAMHPEVSRILNQRSAAARAKEVADKERLAKTSIKGAPGGSSGGADPTNLRATLEAAFDGKN